MRWLTRRNNVWYFVRNVPRKFSHVVDARQVRLSAETSDDAAAIAFRDRINAELEEYWLALARGGGENATARYEAAIRQARLEGFAWRTTSELATKASIDEIAERLALVEAEMPPEAANGDFSRERGMAGQDERNLVVALTGGVNAPELYLSSLLKTYEDLTRDRRTGKSDQQLRKWRNPRKLAIRELIARIGDKKLVDITRSDALAWRAWMTDRIVAGKYKPASANKTLACLTHMLRTTAELLDLGLGNPFEKLHFKEGRPVKRPSFSTTFIRENLLAPNALAGLNEAARAIVLIMVETGARPSELCNMPPDAIHLENDIPYISIAPDESHDLKTVYSERELPLVGVALAGARLMKDLGALQYAGRNATLSATVNKYFAENNLLESEAHSLYGLRHSFKDRLVEAGASDTIETTLMGHKFDRPDYGKGPSMALKLEWMERIRVA